MKTATISCPASMSLRNDETANSGVPIKISLICPSSLNQIRQDEYAAEPQSHRELVRKISGRAFSAHLIRDVYKKSGRKIEREARLSGLCSRRVLFSLFFVSNFETDLRDQVLPFNQSQRLVFQHAGGFGVQF